MAAPVTVRRALLCAAALFSAVLASFAAQATTTQTATPAPLQPKFFVNGYVQGRYSDTLGERTANSSFELKRAYINLLAQVDEHISAVIMVSGAPNTSVKEAYGEYKFNPELKARLGLVRLPFGYEVMISSSQLVTLERSQVVSALLAKDFNFDRGLFAYYAPAHYPVNIGAAITNGSFTDLPKTVTDPGFPTDDNENKNFVARVGAKIPGGQVGASVYTGKHPTGEQTMDRYGYDVEYTTKGFTVISEGLIGKGAQTGNSYDSYNGDADAAGAYVTFAYRKPGTALQPYVRLESYDPDTNTSGNNYRRGTIGANYYLKGNTKLTLEYQTIDDKLNPNVDGAIAAQYQVSF